MEYFEPNFLDEALVVLDRYGSHARVLAGGTLLGFELRAAPETASALVNVKRVPSLASIEFDGATLRIGALATAQTLAKNRLVCENAPLLAQAAAHLGSRQLRSVATIGGNVLSHHHAADLSTALLAHGARIACASARDGASEIPIARLLSEGVRGLGHGALLTSILVPVSGAKAAYVKMQVRRAFELALVSAAAIVRLDGATVADVSIALGGAAETPVRATHAESILLSKRLTRETIAAAGQAASQADAAPRDDHRATAQYRRHLVRVLLERALVAITEQLIAITEQEGKR